jgi:hypothetical protein
VRTYLWITTTFSGEFRLLIASGSSESLSYSNLIILLEKCVRTEVEEMEEAGEEPQMLAAAVWPGVEEVRGPAGQHTPIVYRMMVFE